MNKENRFKMLEGRINIMQSLAVECIELIYKAGYNEGVEAVLRLGFDGREEVEIRKLKK